MAKGITRVSIYLIVSAFLMSVFLYADVTSLSCKYYCQLVAEDTLIEAGFNKVWLLYDAIRLGALISLIINLSYPIAEALNIADQHSPYLRVSVYMFMALPLLLILVVSLRPKSYVHKNIFKVQFSKFPLSIQTGEVISVPSSSVETTINTSVKRHFYGRGVYSDSVNFSSRNTTTTSFWIREGDGTETQITTVDESIPVNIGQKVCIIRAKISGSYRNIFWFNFNSQKYNYLRSMFELTPNYYFVSLIYPFIMISLVCYWGFSYISSQSISVNDTLSNMLVMAWCIFGGFVGFAIIAFITQSIVIWVKRRELDRITLPTIYEFFKKYADN